jgi:hypothetical protein
MQYNSNMEKRAKTFRLSEKAIALLLALAKKDGITQTAELEITIRERAETRGVEVERPEEVNQ